MPRKLTARNRHLTDEAARIADKQAHKGEQAMNIGQIKRRLHNVQPINEDDVRTLLRHIATTDYPSMRAMARAWKVSPPHLSDILRGRRSPGLNICQRLGVTKTVVKLVSYKIPAQPTARSPR